MFNADSVGGALAQGGASIVAERTGKRMFEPAQMPGGGRRVPFRIAYELLDT